MMKIKLYRKGWWRSILQGKVWLGLRALLGIPITIPENRPVWLLDNFGIPTMEIGEKLEVSDDQD